MNIKEMQTEIARLKKQTDTAVLAHSYQGHEIIEAADSVGDSFQLSLLAQKSTAKNILLCGVHFMAETAKMLSPQKRVFLANPLAGCPMAEQMEPEMLQYMKKQEPDRTVVAYINTTAALKTECDVCVTSSTAVSIVRKIKNHKILFIPDCNLGDFVKRNVPEKDIKLVQGGCPVHAAVTLRDLESAKQAHPDALVLVHPECIPTVVERADYVGSTSGIMDFAKKSDAKEFLIGTEMSIAEHLSYECPDKRFYVLSKKILCPNMKVTTLADVYNTLAGIAENRVGAGSGDAHEMIMSDELIAKARVCIDEMIRLGKE